MFPKTELLVFVTAALFLLVTPGPAVFFIVAQSAQNGIRSGIVSATGVVIGGLIHVVVGAAGVSALITSSPILFGVVKYCGAFYLIYLGILALANKGREQRLQLKISARRAAYLFRDGLLVNLLNPKTAVFFLAFLPQFIEQGSSNAGTQFLILGLIMITMGLITDTMYAIAAGKAVGLFSEISGKSVYFQWVAASIYFILGIFTLMVKPLS